MCKSHLDLMCIGDKYVENGIFTASEDAVTMMNEVQKNGGEAAYFMFGTELLGEHHQNRFDFISSCVIILALITIPSSNALNCSKLSLASNTPTGKETIFLKASAVYT